MQLRHVPPHLRDDRQRNRRTVRTGTATWPRGRRHHRTALYRIRFRRSLKTRHRPRKEMAVSFTLRSVRPTLPRLEAAPLRRVAIAADLPATPSPATPKKNLAKLVQIGRNAKRLTSLTDEMQKLFLYKNRAYIVFFFCVTSFL